MLANNQFVKDSTEFLEPHSRWRKNKDGLKTEEVPTIESYMNARQSQRAANKYLQCGHASQKYQRNPRHRKPQPQISANNDVKGEKSESPLMKKEEQKVKSESEDIEEDAGKDSEAGGSQPTDSHKQMNLSKVILILHKDKGFWKKAADSKGRKHLRPAISYVINTLCRNSDALNADTNPITHYFALNDSLKITKNVELTRQDYQDCKERAYEGMFLCQSSEAFKKGFPKKNFNEHLLIVHKDKEYEGRPEMKEYECWNFEEALVTHWINLQYAWFFLDVGDTENSKLAFKEEMKDVLLHLIRAPVFLKALQSY